MTEWRTHGHNIRKCKEIQVHKILKFGEDSSRRNNPDKVFYNFSSDTLSKRLNFALPTTSLEYSDYLVDYQLFFRDTFTFESSHLNRELLKSRLKNFAFLYFKTYNSFRKATNLTLKNLNLFLTHSFPMHPFSTP